MRATLALLGVLLVALMIPAAPAAPSDVIPVTHEEMGRAFDDFAAHLHGLGERFRRHFTLGEAGPERPLVTYMLDHRSDLALTPAQVEELERIRGDFQKEAIKLDADQRVAEMDVASFLRTDPVDIGRVEARIREAERLNGEGYGDAARWELMESRVRREGGDRVTLIHRLRQRFGALLRQEVARTVADQADIHEEIHYLCDVLVKAFGQL